MWKSHGAMLATGSRQRPDRSITSS
jgi:hypothetical protein